MPVSQRIEDYALISDCAAGALVGRNGSIDWLCLPRFDSAACFAALLGEPEHGRWLIAPADPAARVERRYLDGSLILVTRFETAEGAVELVDSSAHGMGSRMSCDWFRGSGGASRCGPSSSSASIMAPSCPGSSGFRRGEYRRSPGRKGCSCALRRRCAA